MIFRSISCALLILAGDICRANDEHVQHMLFAGHSFFHPLASKMEQLSDKYGIENSKVSVIAAGGKTGSPEALWFGAHADDMKRMLDTGEVDLLGLTVYSEETSEIEDFNRWIEYALERNPDTDFVIGLPWGKLPATKSAQQYGQENLYWEGVLEEIVAQIQNENPHTEILLINYGKGALNLRRMLEAGELEGMSLIGNRASAIYTDELGHAGNALAEVSVWLWMDFFFPELNLSERAARDSRWAKLAYELTEQ